MCLKKNSSDIKLGVLLSCCFPEFPDRQYVQDGVRHARYLCLEYIKGS